MTRSRSLLTITLLSGIVACSAADTTARRFVEACTTGTDMPEPLCTCLAERAEDEISDDARALLLAMMEKDEETAARLRSSIPVTDAMQAGMFLTQAGQCAPPENAAH